MPEGMTTSFPKALYLLDRGAFERIYGEEERAAVAGLADVYAPLQTGKSVAKTPGVLAEAEVILSGWGTPAMDGGFLAAAPNLRVVFYGAGSIRRVAPPTCGPSSTSRPLNLLSRTPASTTCPTWC